jgi:DNA polymerase-1
MVNVLNEYWYKDLKSLATYFFDADDYAKRLVHDWLRSNIKKTKDRTFDKVPTNQIHEYLLCDIEYNLNLYFALKALLYSQGRYDMPYADHEMPQVNMLAKVEHTGFAVDTERVKQEQTAMGRDVDILADAVCSLSDGKIATPGSNDQVAEYLHSDLKLPVVGYTATGKRKVGKEELRVNQHLPI